MFLVLVVLIPFTSIFTALVNLVKPGAFDLKLDIDEDLSNYFHALEDEDKTWMILEEENMRRHYVRIIFIILTLLGYENFAR